MFGNIETELSIVKMAPRSAETWSKAITVSWGEVAERIFETGHYLRAAQVQLGSISRLTLPFGKHTAERLMAIAANAALATHVSQLPPSWGTLYELSRLEANSRGGLKTGGRPMSGGKASRDKGNRIEHELVRLLQAAGFAAERVPLSGAAGGRFANDVSVPVLGRDMRVEVKARADGFRELYKWLDGSDLLVVRADRAEALVVLPRRLAITKFAERNKEEACDA